MNIIRLPGLIDIHVHLRTPGQTHKENFSTGTKAAIAGGFTTIFDMPNNKIPITTAARLERKIRTAKNKIYSDVGFYFGSLGDNLTEFERVANKVYGLKLYLNETTGNFLISKDRLTDIFKAWKKVTNKPVLVHAEEDAIEAVINISKRIKQQVHFCHISLASDLKQIIRTKEAGVKITCGVTPHHLFLTQDDAKKLGPYGRMKPFLKSAEDVKFLWKNIEYIDAVESDHAPHTKAEKDSDTPPYGVPGLETTLPLLLTAVHAGKLEVSEIKRLCYSGPKKILHLKHDTGKIEVDLDQEYVINNDELFTKCGWSPFAGPPGQSPLGGGRKVYGKVKKVTLRGKAVFENGKFRSMPQGKVI